MRVLDRATQRLAQRSELSLSAAEQVLAAHLPEQGRRALEVLQRAVIDRTPVSCRYYSITRDSDDQREIEPYGLYRRRRASAAALSRAFAYSSARGVRLPVSPHPLPRHVDETSYCDALLTMDCASGGYNLLR
jgi:hypothetical protein